MGKTAGFTPKAIANRIKSKGLQKLRWYCQMCEKQCRDENGFKCHLTSESHKRQMEIFGENPHKVIENYSTEFEHSFLEHLRVSHPFSRVSAKNVYNELISQKNHIHMNATKWLSLTEFVKYLGRNGKCKVDETDKGWYIMLIQKDPFEELDEKKRVKRDRSEREEEERHRRMLEDQIARAQQMARIDEDGGEGDEDNGGNGGGVEGPIGFTLAAGAKPIAAAAALEQQRKAPAAFLETADDNTAGNVSQAGGHQHKKSKVEELMEKELKFKQQRAAAAAEQQHQQQQQQQQPSSATSATWLAPGIVVKVMSKALKEHGYYKQKGVVLKILDKKIGEIEMVDSGDVLRIDQRELETVIPQPGGVVLILGGHHKGKKGSLVKIDTDKFRAQVELDGSGDVEWFEYEDISKMTR